MRSQDQSSGTKKQGAGGPRSARRTPTAIAMNHAVTSRSPEAVLALQRAAGNAAVARLAEQEQHEHDAGCGHGTPVQRSGVDQVLRSPGRPLAEPVRRDMEARLGADFGDVRLHDDAAARRSAASVGARAYTSGSHVVIGDGGGDSHTLAHELTHVIQQRQGPVAGTDNGSGLRISDPSDRFEREAEANAARVMSAPAPARAEQAAATGVQRSADATQGSATAVQRMPTAAPPQELTLMPGADRHAMGGDGGFFKYTVPSIGSSVDPAPM
ncbi:eCIS core domain-containing protein, partial [Streptomyces sp. 7R007]